MAKGVGIDIIEIGRIKAAIEKYGENFLKKVFTKKEIDYCCRRKVYRYPELSVRFAAKEAYSKAMGVGIAGFGRGSRQHRTCSPKPEGRRGMKWTEIEIVNNSLGKPHIAVNGKISEKAQVSLSHSRDYAVATVYIEE
ncbi:MAG: holo-ACP synthase [Candidatus Margulisiibacteriota bacterium]|nr:holo-ACP synthase [Candidatus Margulisiibacteriota bacterium]